MEDCSFLHPRVPNLIIPFLPLAEGIEECNSRCPVTIPFNPGTTDTHWKRGLMWALIAILQSLFLGSITSIKCFPTK